ncbi:MAG: site-specific DNA-methyltransferase [Deltaproteobacteria bacterium]|nr:MAG: site-specific DNA-methyltransferase [Deltaproteobacteria bacterium]
MSLMANGAVKSVELCWEGKAQSRRLAEEPGDFTLERVRSFGSPCESDKPDGCDSLLIEGDNLDAMKVLLGHLEGGIDLVYIDPPFFTGRVRGGSGGKAYDDRWGGELAGYLSMFYPRLLLIHRLLAGAGSLLVHVDYRLAGPVRILCDEVFGQANFRNQVIWHYRSGGRSRKHYGRKHDVIFWYTKSGRYHFDATAVSVPRNRCRLCGAELEAWNHMKSETDEKGRPFRTIRSAGRIYRYYDDDKVLDSDVWLGIAHLQQRDPERCGYPTQKPLKLLERLVGAHSRPKDLVADFFCGSATTLVAARRLGRRFIGCDSSRHAIECAIDRLGGDLLHHLCLARVTARNRKG